MNSIPKLAAAALALLAIQMPASERITEELSKFSSEELEQIVAPVALYPDALLAQIFMASTYPLEVVQADRWLEKNPDLEGAALEEVLKPQSWDPSVKALCGFPSVVALLSENLEWTRDLGDAFLGQKAELMDSVQRMRAKARDTGTLRTTEEQRVVQDGDMILVEPSSPQIVYVPVYSPVIIYGPGWYYPHWHYPAFFAPPPYGAGFVTFGFGYSWGPALWGHCDWHHHTLIVDVVQYRTFVTRTYWAPPASIVQDASRSHVEWRHDPMHRRGVSYRSPGVVPGIGAGSGTARPLRERPRPLDRPKAFTRPAVPAPRANPAPPVRPAPPTVPPDRTRPIPPERPRPGGSELGRTRPRTG